jgi:glycerophosphoryl diester phosphodiesterase
LAAELGADAVELDAMLTRDSVVVVCHDRRVERTTSGVGKVREIDFEELRSLDAGGHFSSEYEGTPIPSLDEVIHAVGEDLLINIELKTLSLPWGDLPQRVVSTVREYKMERRVLISSFNPLAILAVKRIAAEIPSALLVHQAEPKPLRLLLEKALSYDAYHPQEQLVSRRILEAQTGRGRMVNVWTVNEERRMRELMEWGVSGVITDDPHLAVELRRELFAV